MRINQVMEYHSFRKIHNLFSISAYKEMGLTEFELHHLLVQCTVITDLQLFLHFFKEFP